MKLKIYTIFIVNIFLIFFKTNACGYIEYDWDYRTMTFQVMLPDMQSLQPFIYTDQSIYKSERSDVAQTDRKRNIEEWQKVTSSSINWEDIYTIQYNTDPVEFVTSYSNNQLSEYKGNSFIKFLLSDNKYTPLLEYLVFAKKNESLEFNIFEEWDDNEDESVTINLRSKLIEEAESKIKSVSSDFLKERYAYQLVRLYWQTDQPKQSVESFDSYFKKTTPNSLMHTWASLFKAMSLDNLGRNDEANVYYIYAFDNSNEKKLRAVQLFNRDLPISTKLTKHEQSVAYVINTINNPGRSLKSLEKIESLDQTNKYLPFLLTREVNKLEDWLVSYIYIKLNDFRFGYEDGSSNFENETKKQNYLTDLQYLTSLKKFVLQLRSNSKDTNIQDLYSIILAHLSILEEDKEEAEKYLADISQKASLPISRQKTIDELWLSIKTENVSTNAFKEKYTIGIDNLKKVLSKITENKEIDYSKVIYTLDLSLANEYKKKGDIVSFGLLNYITDIDCNTSYADTDFYNNDNFYYYTKLQIFDRYASISDIDKLISLIKKKDKTKFEKYLCNQKLNTVDAYYDLKGTIAFRSNDLQTAYEAFSCVKGKYENNEYFSSILNEDPFVPKYLKNRKSRDFSYKFEKNNFLKKLIELEEIANGSDKEKAAEASLKLGHAFFNTSYWGNSWMMTAYGWSQSDIYFGEREYQPKWKRNYMTASNAIKYYKQALVLATNNEQKAYATLMLQCIYSNNAILNIDKNAKSFAIKYAREYDNTYRNKTLFDKQNECLGYEAFLL